MDCVCEMCLRRKATERHHIIPRVADVEGFDIDRDDNIIALCSVCHSRLTPTSALSSYGIRKVQAEQKQKDAVLDYAQAVWKRIDDEMPCSLSSRDVVEMMFEELVKRGFDVGGYDG